MAILTAGAIGLGLVYFTDQAVSGGAVSGGLTDMLAQNAAASGGDLTAQVASQQVTVADIRAGDYGTLLDSTTHPKGNSYLVDTDSVRGLSVGDSIFYDYDKDGIIDRVDPVRQVT